MVERFCHLPIPQNADFSNEARDPAPAAKDFHAAHWSNDPVVNTPLGHTDNGSGQLSGQRKVLRRIQDDLHAHRPDRISEK